MSVDSKLFVTCSKEDVITLGSSVAEALNKYSRQKLDDYWTNNTDACNRFHFLHNESYKGQREKFTNGVSITSYNFDMFTFTFGNGDDSLRSLHMFPTCSDDHNDIVEGYKVIFSIGYWGGSDEILMVVAEAIKEFGEVYYDFNDCDDLDFIKL